MNFPEDPALFEGIGRVWVDGSFVPIEAAVVSVFDRGLIFGDGVYEVLPVYGGRPFRLDEHIDRLERSLGEVGIPMPMPRDQWRQMVLGLITDAPADQSVYIQVTRGVAPRDHAFPEGARPTVFAYTQALAPVPRAALHEGVSAVILEDIRWHRCDIKATSLLANVLLRQWARERGCSEALLSRDGIVHEGAASNLFLVRDGVVRTPPKGPHMLPGITRDLVVELLHGAGIELHEAYPHENEVRAADELWLTSSTREVMPLTRLDAAPVADGRPGPMFRRVHALYQAYKDAVRSGRAA